MCYNLQALHDPVTDGLLLLFAPLLREESRHRTAVMRKLGFVDGQGVVTLKGQAAACIDTTDELLSAGRGERRGRVGRGGKGGRELGRRYRGAMGSMH